MIGVINPQIAVCLGLTNAISRIRTVEEIYNAALDALTEGIGVSRSAVLLFDSDGVMRFKEHRGLSDAYRRAVEGHTPWAPDTPDPEPVFVPDAALEPSLQPYLPALEREGIAGMATGHCVSRSVRDSAALLDATQGPAPGDPYTAPALPRPLLEEVGRSPGRLRIALCTTDYLGNPIHPACAAAAEAAARLCASLVCAPMCGVATTLGCATSGLPPGGMPRTLPASSSYQTSTILPFLSLAR